MAAIVGELGKLRALTEQVLRRQQQTALMVDGFGSTLGRRFDVLHEETALLRVGLQRPVNDVTETSGLLPIDVSVERTKGQKAAHVVALTGKALSYATTGAIGLRLLGKVFPEYEAAIDGLLGLFGL